MNIYKYIYIYIYIYKYTCVLIYVGRQWADIYIYICTYIQGDTATHCNTLQHTRADMCPLSDRQHTATHYNTLQHNATHCNTLQHLATHSNTATHCNTLQHTAIHGWDTATHCNTLHLTGHSATRNNVCPPRVASHAYCSIFHTGSMSFSIHPVHATTCTQAWKVEAKKIVFQNAHTDCASTCISM